MKTDEIRESFLRFFEGRGHARHPGDSLVPTNDPSLLFTGAGMNQFKDMFLGKGSLPFKRATTAQKCVRTGDIDNVGRTAGHHTFFEMMGNFSFGDYFKREAILWAWEWVIEKLPRERLSVSVYKEDEEAYGIWEREIKVPRDKIYRFGEHDNFWPADAPSASPPGTLCGPCSEIFYDRGEGAGCGRKGCDPACDCGRHVEIWNLVFQQFEKGSAPGELRPLPMKNIDTGLGLERMAAVMQGVRTNFDIDVLRPIVERAAELTGQERFFDKSARIAPGDEKRVMPLLRRIADHGRAVTFMITDGVLPGNEGRGYVVRRLIRRAVVDGRTLGREEAFVCELVPLVADLMKAAYPELAERRENVERIVRMEEENFSRTLTKGLALLNNMRSKYRADGELPGEEAFKLYDTYGFPLELAEEILGESGIRVAREGFEREMAAQRRRARTGSDMGESIFDEGPLAKVKEIIRTTEFLGYDALELEASAVALVVEERLAEETRAGDDVRVIVDRTPFYAESGGQVGDAGKLYGPSCEARVTDVTKYDGIFVHRAEISSGVLRRGERVRLCVDPARRLSIARNHTATHLLHHCLRKKLGEHVEQSGSFVAPLRLRLDFTHFEAIPKESLAQVERAVNDLVMADIPVAARRMEIGAAKAEGAIALFGEKYGREVRLVDIGGISKELCAGTHLARTGEVGPFRIIGEGSVAAGIRRIEAITGAAAVESVQRDSAVLSELAAIFKAPPEELPAHAKGLLEEEKRRRKEMDGIRRERAASAAGDLISRIKDAAGVRLLAANVGEATAADLRASLEEVKAALGEGVAVLGGSCEGKASFLCWVSPGLVGRGYNAGEIVRRVAEVAGGSGGGRPDVAQAGSRDPSKMEEALRAAEDALRTPGEGRRR